MIYAVLHHKTLVNVKENCYINGWDLKKALVQFHRGNATLFEWSNSPIVYRETEEWKRIYDVAKGYFSMKAAIHHYYGTANSTYCRYLQEEPVIYKKYFYAIRPLLAGKFIQEYQCPPPVRFDELLKMDLPIGLRSEIAGLLEIKRGGSEGKKGMWMPMIQAFIADEIVRQRAHADRIVDDRKREWDRLNDVFLQFFGHFDTI